MVDTGHPGAYATETLLPLIGSLYSATGQAVPAFAAAYNIGPTIPMLVNSWQQYIALYGGFTVANGNYLPYAVSQFFANGGNACYVLRVANTDAVQATTNLQDIAGSPINVLTVTSKYVGAYGNQLYVGVVAAGTGYTTVSIYQGGTTSNYLVEQYNSVSMNPADPRYIVNIVNSPTAGSNFVTLTPTLPSGVYTLGTTDLAVIAPKALSAGTDGTVAPTLGTAVPAQLDTLQNTILNVNLPGITNTTTLNLMITWAAGREDVMIIADGPPPSFPETSAQVVTNYTTQVTAMSASTYCAIYAPWVLIQDPSSSIPGATTWQPPGGAVLGVWNNVDQVAGVQQTPAGTSYGKINAVALETSFAPADLDNLNNANINAIKSVPGTGFCIYGGRTLKMGYPDRYLSVRRTLMKLEHDFVLLTQFAVFEPNDTSTWNQIIAVLTNYLLQAMQAGLLGGTTPATSFSVVCDATNNSPAQVTAGIVNVSVAVALLSPAEFIFINIQQLQQNVT
jgi:Bacteriophage tail sheath protein